ncbi:pyridoxamine 5'-phosphate oxidase family protein [Nocardioides caricicola]|uniref:Pyridoxamine 5'-phosphate oxidase family protein n=1 Tax=Nocardioides caricicola TaxID=634770 RepID=A0ABW0N998_9ACTN
MTGIPSPAILTAYDCWRLLEHEEIARVAWATGDTAAVVPVNFTVVDGALWFRVHPSSALGQQCRGGRVAVEVDHLDGSDRSAWSVVVQGTAQPVDIHDVPDQAMEIRLWPAGPFSMFVRVEPDEVTGRRL